MSGLGSVSGNEGAVLGLDWQLVLLAGMAALLFGLMYNWIADQFRKAKLMDYLVAVLVVFGVAGTVLIGVLFGVIDLGAAVVLFILFACSGVPMIIGQLCPVVKARKRELERLHDGD